MPSPEAIEALKPRVYALADEPQVRAAAGLGPLVINPPSNELPDGLGDLLSSLPPSSDSSGTEPAPAAAPAETELDPTAALLDGLFGEGSEPLPPHEDSEPDLGGLADFLGLDSLGQEPEGPPPGFRFEPGPGRALGSPGRAARSLRRRPGSLG